MHASTSTAASDLQNTTRRGQASSRSADVREPSAAEMADPRGLGAYFRGLSSLDLMSKEEELAAAVRIAELRASLWRALLDHAPFIDQICAVARELLSEEACPMIGRREAAAACADDEALRDALAEELSRADLDGVVVDRLLAALTGREPVAHESVLVRYRSAVRARHAALVAAKNAFVKANLRLVVMIARRFDRGTMPLEDLIQEGNVGLMKAVDRFDHRKGFRFSTYGSWWIRHAIGRAITDKGRSVRLPVQISHGCSKVKRARRDFEALHGRPPTDEELMAQTGISGEQIRRMRWALVETPLSLEQPIAGDSGMTLLDTIEDDDVLPAEVLESASQVDRLHRAIGALTATEADIVRCRVGIGCDDEMSLAELAERYGLSRERIRQIQEQALRKLRRELTRKPWP